MGLVSGVSDQISWKKKINNGYRASSRDKLPGISLHQKLQMFSQRCENQIFSQIIKIDKHTLNDVYHVSEFCSDIH